MPPDFFKLHLQYIVSPLIPLICGIVRFKKIDPVYHSLIFVFAAATIAEFTRFIMAYFYYTTNVYIFRSFIGYNLYVIAIGLLYTHFFYKLGIFENRKWLYHTLMIALPLVWFIDHFILKGNQVHEQTIVYRLFYAFFLCLYAINQINRLLVGERRNLLMNSSFLVCFCLLFFFLPYIISEGIFLFNRKTSDAFIKSVFLFRSIANPINYIIFTLAVLWIPPKKNFIQLS